MKAISKFFISIANWKTLLFFLALEMLFNSYILPNAAKEINSLCNNQSPGPIDLTFGFNPEKSLSMISQYSEAAKKVYARTEMTKDVLYPIVYTFLFAIILSLLFKNTPLALVNVLPMISGIFDLLENSMIVSLLYSYPNNSHGQAVLLEIFKLLKWISTGFVIFLILYGLIKKYIISKKSA